MGKQINQCVRKSSGKGEHIDFCGNKRLSTSRRWSKVSMASRLASSAWLCWASLRLCATICSWLWVIDCNSSSLLRRQLNSRHFAPSSFNCRSASKPFCSISFIWAWRPAAADLDCLISSFNSLESKPGGRLGEACSYQQIKFIYLYLWQPYLTVWLCSAFSLSNTVHFISNSSFSLSHSIRLSFSLFSLSNTLETQMQTILFKTCNYRRLILIYIYIHKYLHKSNRIYPLKFKCNLWLVIIEGFLKFLCIFKCLVPLLLSTERDKVEIKLILDFSEWSLHDVCVGFLLF